VGAGRGEVRGVKRLAFLAAVVLAIVLPAAASAHPLGNFTVNRFSRIEVAGPRIYVRYVLDLAEIPTFQAGRIDAHVYARRIARGAHLTVNGRRVRLIPIETVLAHPPGAGGLRTTRLETILRGPTLGGASAVEYRDTNYGNRIGWKEIIVGLRPSTSHELRAYPQDLLSSPLTVTSVRTRVVPGTVTGTRPHVAKGAGLQAPDRVADSGFAALVGRDRLGFWVIVASLGAALFWGMAHALSPGHGKTIVTAYLVGQRGTPRHAALLGLVVTATHTVGVFALGAVTLVLSRFIVPEVLYPWLNFVSGVLVVLIGASVLRSRWRHRRAHTRGHDHHHHHEHEHGLSRRSLVAVGVSGGLLPCPSALVVLLAAITLHRVAFGMLLVVAFSAGLALTITGIGLAAVLARGAFRRVTFDGRVVSLLPTASALVIVAAGLVMTLHALPRVG
jgi:ABC-type nickel/cobalt efflux system permease component RcnA